MSNRKATSKQSGSVPGMAVPRDIIQAVFTLSRLWERVFDRAFRDDGISVKQFFLMAVIDRSFEAPPSLSEAAEVLKMSYQNVKKLALQLEERGFFSLVRDANDRRTLRIHITPACRIYWSDRTPGDEDSFNALFEGLNSATAEAVLKTLNLLIANAEL